MYKSKYAVIGGDLRSVKLANLIKADMNEVNIYGFSNAGFETGIVESECLEAAIKGAKIVIGPIPCTNDNESLNAPFGADKIYLEDLFKMMDSTQLFIAGKINKTVTEYADRHGIKYVDLLEREEMAVLNAIPTAEGAIQIAMEEMPITLHNSKALVLGFGRIGKILAKMLQGIGSQVYVEARKPEDIAWINSYCYKPVHLNNLKEYIGKMDVIFNTIPYVVLNNELIKEINPNTLIIDLASKPGGVDLLVG